MFTLNVKIEQNTNIVVDVAGQVRDRRGMHAVLGVRLEEELQEYFLTRNAEPNKRGWRKLGWWQGVADATALDSVSEDGAEVRIAHREGFAIRARGGVIEPREAKALTIPNVEEAYGKSVAEYERATGRRLFRPAGARYLAYGDDNKVTLVYFLVKRANIKQDKRALPSRESIGEAMHEELSDFFKPRNSVNN